MKTHGIFISYVILSVLAATSSGLLWRPFRPTVDDPDCGSSYCPIGNQMACLVKGSQVFRECISQWKPCYIQWYQGCKGSRRRMYCALTRRGCKCTC
uniref:Putative secreted peptide n=1 Tax=Rhipicephalus pulchellus TaxID=72859 RepID=L7M977_RHIPC